MIDINKKYRTRRGGEVVGLAEHNHLILGWEIHEDSHKAHVWFPNGLQNFPPDPEESPYDLIEINKQEELLEEARRRYPKGTKFKCLTGVQPEIVTTKGRLIADNTTVYDEDGNWCYKDGQWAEIVKEHTVEVYVYKDESGDIDILSTRLQTLNLIAKKQITFYEREGL